MEIVDIVIIVAALASVVVGLFRGLVKEAISIASLLVAIWAAMRLGPAAGGWLGGTIDSTEVQLWAGRFLIFVVVLIAGAIAGWVLSKIVHFDRALGGFFGLMRALLFVGVFVLAGRYTGFDTEPWWLQSEFIPLGEQIADWIIEMAPRSMELLQHMPEELEL
jgi:membrane protein required for colicin V production